jgi:hypothetical protein
MLSFRINSCGLLACLGILCAGCGGGDSTTRYDVAGTVTFDGKPVPAGVILFTPDVSKNNRGPTGFAKIKDGKYDTRQEGKGTVGGPHTVAISGSDGARLPQQELPDGMPLFTDYGTAVDLPKAATTQDFEVPASAKHGGTPSGRLPRGAP